MKFLTLNMFRAGNQLFLKLVETDLFLQYMSPGVRFGMGIKTMQQILDNDFKNNEYSLELKKCQIFIADNDCNEGPAKQEQYVSRVTTIEIPKDVRKMNDLFSALGQYVKNGRFNYCQISDNSVLDEITSVADMTVMQQFQLFPHYHSGRAKFSFDWYVKDAEVTESDQAKQLTTTLKTHLEKYNKTDESTADDFTKRLVNTFLTLTEELKEELLYQAMRNALQASISYANRYQLKIYHCTNQYIQLKCTTRIDDILLNPKVSQQEKQSYLFEISRQLVASNTGFTIKDVLGWIYDENLTKLYRACAGHPDPDKHEYSDKHSEYRFLQQAQFDLLEDGRLCIRVKNNPVFKKEYTDRKAAQLEKELRHMSKWIDFEFDEDAQFNDIVTFTKDCSLRLMTYGLHLNAHYFSNQKREQSQFFQQRPLVEQKNETSQDAEQTFNGASIL